MSDAAPAGAGVAVLAVDCADPPALARFWASVLGVYAGDRFYSLGQ